MIEAALATLTIILGVQVLYQRHRRMMAEVMLEFWEDQYKGLTAQNQALMVQCEIFREHLGVASGRKETHKSC